MAPHLMTNTVLVLAETMAPYAQEHVPINSSTMLVNVTKMHYAQNHVVNALTIITQINIPIQTEQN